MNQKDLKKALKNRPKFDLEWVPEVQEWFEGFEAKFSVFLVDYDKQRKQLFDKCAYVDFEGNPAIVCNLCRFYHGLQKGCSWEEEKKELLEAQK